MPSPDQSKPKHASDKPKQANKAGVASGTPPGRAPRVSPFKEHGLKKTIADLAAEIRELYVADDVPWIIGYSGGKDSTATLQLIWTALSELPPEQRTKTVHVISTDTLVENPVVAAWVTRSLDAMRRAAKQQNLPFQPHRLTPTVEDSFWVNLIGKGYPAPRFKFRWCTERLKIRPSNHYIMSVVNKNGHAVLCLGARKSESQARARVIERASKHRIRDKLNPNPTMPGCFVYTPIENWNNDEVWMFLTQVANPWGHNNKDLLGMYAGASADGECPLVVDTSTPSCGDSRFGCWVCTLVEKDKSMSAMIQNDTEKEWMLPLLKLRNKLDFRMMGGDDQESSDHHLRDFRRMNGSIQLMQNGKAVPGPYLQSAREDWLRELLKAQTWIRTHGPDDVRSIELITLEELQEIRRIWVVEKHEMEDLLPRIYAEETGQPYPGPRLDDSMELHADDLALLREACGDDALHYELTRELLGLTRQHRNDQKRSGHYERIEKAFGRHYYDGEQDALSHARTRAAVRQGTLKPDEASTEAQS
jgi:DNA sulfur modification protein DndC